MANGKYTPNPVKGGIKRRKRAQPSVDPLSSDASIIRYNTVGDNVDTTGSYAAAAGSRVYIPGSPNGMPPSAPGPRIVANYSTGKFLPGTSVRWEPSVSFTQSGRIYVGFTDNPEVIEDVSNRLATYLVTPNSTTYGNLAAVVKGFGNVMSFPVWQETSIQVPSRLRRKRFDTNANASTDADILDRSAQIAMFYVADGVNELEAFLGSFHYHDVVQVEGVTLTIT